MTERKLIEINWQPTLRQLRQFSAISMVAIPLLVAAWTRGDSTILLWTIGGSAIAGSLGLAWPKLARPIFIGLSLLTAPIGMVVGELAMLLIFGCLFIPMAIVFRWKGRDALGLRRRGQASYWTEKPKPSQGRSYFNQW